MKSREEEKKGYEERLEYINEMLELSNNRLMSYKGAEGYIVKVIGYLISERDACLRRLMKLRREKREL